VPEAQFKAWIKSQESTASTSVPGSSAGNASGGASG